LEAGSRMMSVPVSSLGGWGHATRQCRPCNKFVAGKPNSCKHAEKCMFCHELGHIQPKHRGQRGRHAIQRRQFLEDLKNYPVWFQELVHSVYDVPHTVMADLKKKLYEVQDLEQRKSEVRILAAEITRIGQAAQKKRPACPRIQDSCFQPPETMTVADLDGRLKWLQGTFHLMIRKIYESDPLETKQAELQDTVDKLLRDVRSLVDLAPSACEAQFPSPSEKLQVFAELIPLPLYEKCASHIHDLIIADDSLMGLKALQAALDRLPPSKQDSLEVELIVKGSKNLPDLCSALSDFSECFLDLLMDTDSVLFEDT
jgi:hypothetical protein